MYQLRQTLDAFDTVSPPHLGVQGRPRKITADAEQGLLDFLDDNLTVYQDEMIEFLLSEFDISVTQSTVSKLLKNLNQTYKCTERIYSEKDNELRAHFKAKIYKYKVNQLIFINKSVANKKTKD